MIEGSKSGLGEVGLALCGRLEASGFWGRVKVIDRSMGRNVADLHLRRSFSSQTVACSVLLVSTRSWLDNPIARLLFDHERGVSMTVPYDWELTRDRQIAAAADEAHQLIEEEFIRLRLAQ